MVEVEGHAHQIKSAKHQPKPEKEGWGWPGLRPGSRHEEDADKVGETRRQGPAPARERRPVSCREGDLDKTYAENNHAEQYAKPHIAFHRPDEGWQHALRGKAEGL